MDGCTMSDREELYQTTLGDIGHLKRIQLELLELQKKQETLKESQQEQIATVTLDVFNELDVIGKKKYSNETVRRIEIQQRLNQLSDYQAQEQEIKDLAHFIHQKKIEIEYFRHKIGVNRDYLATFNE